MHPRTTRARPRLALPLLTAVAVSAALLLPPLTTAASPAGDGGAQSVAAKRKHKRLPHRRGGKVRQAWPGKGARGKGRQAVPSGYLERWLARQVGPRKPRKACPRKPRAKRRACLRQRGQLGRGSAVATAAAAAPTGGEVTFTEPPKPEPLRLVRSYDIPKGDPAYDRLLNYSWTYDSALAAMSFSYLSGKQSALRPQAEQLLDQLAALQRSDGSLEYAYDTETGAGAELFRSGTMAYVGLAGWEYRRIAASHRYDKMTDLAMRWLVAQQSDGGLLRGGPDVRWVSTQHNMLAYLLFRQVAKQNARDVSPEVNCVQNKGDGDLVAFFNVSNANGVAVNIPVGPSNALNVGDGSQPDTFPAGRSSGVLAVPFKTGQSVTWAFDNYRKATATSSSKKCTTVPAVKAPAGKAPAYESIAKRIGDAIERDLMKKDGGSTWFIQGLGDPVRPLDVQALGVSFLAGRSATQAEWKASATPVLAYMDANFALSGQAIKKSLDPATFNGSYEAPGPFSGFRPYAGAAGPSLIWMEGTNQARLATYQIKKSTGTKALDASIDAWAKVSAPTGLLGANATVTADGLNEYHVWPTSAASSWLILSRADLGRTPFNDYPPATG